jgi:putative chitinase
MKAFYDAVRLGLFGGRINQSQIDGMNMILEVAPDMYVPQLAYVLATSYHETGRKMQPVSEIGKGRGKAYGKPVPPYNQTYYGRGDVQLTWLENYENAGRRLNIMLAQNPDLALDNNTSKRILVQGMIEGWFAGDKNGRHTLNRWINAKRKDFKGARRIVNGTDKAAQIAVYAKTFEAALIACDWQGQRNEHWRKASGFDEPVPDAAPVPLPTVAVGPEADFDDGGDGLPMTPPLDTKINAVGIVIVILAVVLFFIVKGFM